MLVAGLFAANAAETTIVFSEFYGDATLSGIDAKDPVVKDGVTVTFAQGNSRNAPAYNKAKEVRLYGGQSESQMDGNTMTVAVAQGSTIKSVVFTAGTVDKWGVMTVDNGTWAEDAETHNGTWSGSAETIVFTVNRNSTNPGVSTQNRYKSITVTFEMGEQTKCSNPKFGLKEGKYYTAQEVELTSFTEGCKIMYKVNDGAETEYTAPVKLAEIGKYAISAYAVKEGLENSETVVANYEIAAPVEVASINEFIMQGEADATAAYKWTFPVTVVAQPTGSTYVVDGEGTPLLIYGKEIPAYKEGDVIPAGIVGKFKNYNGLYEMEFPEAATFGAATGNNPVAKTFMKAGEITAADQNKVVYITNATVNAADKLFTDASGSIAYFIQKNWGVDIPEGTYDIRCAVAVYKENVQVYPMEFLTAGSGVEDAVAEAATIVAKEGAIEVNAEGFVAVFNAAGQAVAGQYVDGVATINVAPGFYIVRAADQVAKVIVK